VYRLLKIPENVLGKQQMGKFRMGGVTIDRTPRKIKEIVYMNGKGPTFRYLLEGVSETSYEESELRRTL
jgi:hypothetical protein